MLVTPLDSVVGNTMQHQLVLTLTLSLFLLLSPITSSTTTPPTPNLAVPNDAVALLTFKASADLHNHLLYTLNEPFDFCNWQGVKCQSSRIVRYSLPNSSLHGSFPPQSLTLLSHLRVLDLHRNFLCGPLPDLSPLLCLRSLILSHNLFSSSLPPSLPFLPNLVSLQLHSNFFNGSLPPLNQSSLRIFNVSDNNLSGPIPETLALSTFPPSSFTLNPGLCGRVIQVPCRSNSATNSSTPRQHPSPDQSTAAVLSPPVNSPHNHIRYRLLLILLFSFAGTLMLSSLVFILLSSRRSRQNAANKRRGGAYSPSKSSPVTADRSRVSVASKGGGGDFRDGFEYSPTKSSPMTAERTAEVITVRRVDSRGDEKVVVEGGRREKSGSLVFSEGEARVYTIEQLMRASAEMLGRGTMGTTYKAKLDNQLIVTVKRLDAIRMSEVGGEMFERHLGVVGALRHPNLVAVRAFFQAKDERLIVFDYQPNGSVYSLIHGSRSTRAKPLHWTSCLKIAEDVAQGLAYIHQASKLIHGNLKSSNVLLGADFEACITDYCLATLATSSENEDPDSARYRGPEARQSGRRATHKSDVYAFGVLLLELVSGRPPSQHPFLAPPDMPDWVKAVRGADDGSEYSQLGMLVEVASVCSLTSPEQRPTMWQVLKMIHRIKSSVGSDDAVDASSGYS